MRNTLSTAMIACMVKWIRKRTTDPEVGLVLILMSINNKKREGKGKSEITGGEVSEEGS